MAGNIGNTDILAALNQQIQAINDLTAAVGALVLQTTVNEGDCTPEITFSPTITCTPLVTCTSYAQITGITPGGTEVPDPSGEEGGDPPPGYDPPDPETEDRKCKVSNFLVDQVIAVITKLQIMDVDQYGILGFIVCCSLVGAALGSMASFAGTLIGGVAGAIAAIAVCLVTGGELISFDDIQTLLTDYREDLVCTLYNSTYADAARDSFKQTLLNNGATELEAALCGLCLPNQLTNLLFFTVEEYEPILDGWEVTTECICE